MALISKPVTITAVKNSLGVASTDVGTLCSHPNVRHWARFKPMDMPKMFYDRNYNDANSFWKGKASIPGEDVIRFSGYNYMYEVTVCGLKFYVFGNLTECVLSWDEASRGEGRMLNNYSWDKPKGGATSPYRLTDFHQYDNTAGCQFWSDITDDPSVISKFNISSNDSIMFTLRSFAMGGGHQGLSINELLDCMGATDRKLIAVNWIAKDYNSEPVELTSIDLSPATDYDTTLTFNPSDCGISASTKTQYIIYMLKFNAPINGEYTLLYMPLTQHFEGGENTKVRMFIPSGESRYAVKAYQFVTEPPATMNLECVNWQPSTGEWHGWVSTDNLSKETIVTNNLWLELITTNSSNGNAFVFSKACCKITFRYTRNVGGSSVPGEWVIYGKTSNKVSVSESNTTFDPATQTITVPRNTSGKAIYVSLPNTFSGGSESLNGVKVYQMLVELEKGAGTNEWFKAASFNLNLTVS